MATFKFYLTSLEPDLNQTIYSQSIGGYISNSLLYPETTLSSTIGLYDTILTLDLPSSNSWSDWQGAEYINIGNEVMEIPSFTDGDITVTQRAYNSIFNMHRAGDVVYALSSKELFNDVFNDDYKQYRCIAIKNVSSNLTDPSNEQIAYDLEVYLKQNSRNADSSIKIALEQPSSQYLSGFSTSWSETQLVDSSLIEVYGTDYFNDAYLRITSGEAAGQGKIIDGFDSTTGTFTFSSSFSIAFDFSINVSYEVLPAPSQRIKTGDISPVEGGDNVTFFFATDKDNTLSFFEDGTAFSVKNLNPNDVVYLWIEREIKKGSSQFLNNDFVINVRYKVSE